MGSEGKDLKAESSVAGKRRKLEDSTRSCAPEPSKAAGQSQAQQVHSEGELTLKKAAEGLDAALKVYSSRQEEIKRLEQDLEKANQLVNEQKQSKVDEVAASLKREILLRKSLNETVEKLAAEERTTVELTSRLERKREKLREAASAGKRRVEEGNRFHYVLARRGQAGSIPRSFLESDAQSLLNKMFNGDWDYAWDEQGRALLNCNPDHWAAILDYLTTGTLPVQPNQGLLDQARHWNLQRLVQSLEALIPGVTVTQHSEGNGLTARCNFTNAMGQLDKNQEIELAFCDNENAHHWAVLIKQSGIFLGFRTREYDVDLTKKVHCSMRVMIQESEPLEHEFDKVDSAKEGRGYTFEDWGYSYDQLAREPLAIAHNCIVVEVDISYED